MDKEEGVIGLDYPSGVVNTFADLPSWCEVPPRPKLHEAVKQDVFAAVVAQESAAHPNTYCLLACTDSNAVATVDYRFK